LTGTSDYSSCYNVTTINVSGVNDVMFIGYVNDSAGNLNYSMITVTTGLVPSIGLSVVYPTVNINVTQNKFFNITANVSCLTKDCGEINLTLNRETDVVFSGPSDVRVAFVCSFGGGCSDADDLIGYLEGEGFQVTAKSYTEWNDALLNDTAFDVIVVGGHSWGEDMGFDSATDPARDAFEDEGMPLVIAYDECDACLYMGITDSDGTTDSTENEITQINTDHNIMTGFSGTVFVDTNSDDVGYYQPSEFNDPYTRLFVGDNVDSSYVSGFVMNAGQATTGTNPGKLVWLGFLTYDTYPASTGNDTLIIKQATCWAATGSYDCILRSLVSTTNGTIPFYTNVTNPYNISLNAGESSEITWWINATGTVNSNNTFNLYANLTSNMSISNSTSQWNVTIKSIPGTPTISYPVSGKNYSSITYLNYSATDEDGDSLTYNIYINNILNISGISGNVTSWNASEGYYNMTVTASDGTQTSANSSVTIFRIETTAPSWSNNWTNASLLKINRNATFNITVTDNIGLDYYIFSWNGTGTWDNTTSGSISGSSVNLSVSKSTNLSQGNVIGYNWYANDSAGNMNNSLLRTFTVINTAPNAPTVIYPLDGKNYSDIPYINYSATDEDGDSLTYNIYINNILNISGISGNVTSWNVSEGYYNMTVSASDDSASSQNSSVVHFRLDSIAPIVTITYPTNGSRIASNSIDLNASATDERATTLTYYWVINGTTNTTTVDTNTTFSAGDGYYNLTLFVSDEASNGSSTIFFTLDTTGPVMSFVDPTPSNGKTQTETYVEVNVSITEASLDSVIYDWNGTNYTMYNNSLVLMMNFDNVSALGESYLGNGSTVVDVSSAGNNGVWITNGTNEDDFSVWNATGRYGGAFEFDGVDDIINVAHSTSLNLSSAFTYSIWFNARKLSPGVELFNKGSSDLTDSPRLFIDSDTVYFDISTGAGDAYSETESFTFSTDNWYNIVITGIAGDQPTIYVDSIAAAAYTNRDALQNPIFTNSEPLEIGGSSWLHRYFNGTIDEVRIWNRSLSADEIYQQYISNLKKIDSDSWELYINQSLNATDGLPEGGYTYQAFASDALSNWDNTEERTITRDITHPTWENNKTNITTTIKSGEIAYFNITLNDSNPDKYVFSLYNTTDWVNDTSTSYTDGGEIQVTKTIPALGTINWTWYFNDTANNQNQTDIWGIVVVGDTISPGINFTSPTPANASSQSETNVEINVSITKATDLEKIKFDWNGINETTISISGANITANFTNITSLTNFTFNNGSQTTSLYDDSLILMFNFDNVSVLGENSSFVVDISAGGVHNGTLGEAVDADSGATLNGKYGGAFEFDGSGDAIDLGNVPSLQITAPITLSAWFKADTCTGTHNIISKEGSGFEGYAIKIQDISDRGFVCSSGHAGSAMTYNKPTMGIWYHLTMTDDGTTLKCYVNGVQNASSASDPLLDNDESAYIGDGFDGIIDEARIYTRVLSTDEVYQLYVSNLNKYDSDKWSFVTNATGNYNLTYTLEGSRNDTIELNKFNSSVYYIDINKSDLDDATYTYQAHASDTTGNWNQTEQRTIIIDTSDSTNPSSNITINNSSPRINDVVNVSMNVSDDIGLSHCWFYNNMSDSNSTPINLSGTSDHSSCYNVTTINVSGVNDVMFIGYVNDSAGNLNFSELTITVANTAPTTPTILYPVDGGNYTAIDYMNYSSSDFDGDVITYNIYINGSLNASTTVNLSLWNASDGYYNLTISASDGSDTSANASTVYFTLDSAAPSVSIIYPNDGMNISSNSIDLNASAADTRETSLTYYWVINGTINSTTVDSNSTFNASDGYYNLTLFVSDGLQNGSDSVMFTLDTKEPYYNTTDVVAWGSNTTGSVFYYNVSWKDSNNISTWILSENQTGSWVNHTQDKEWTAKGDNWWIAVMNLTIAAAKGTVIKVVGYANDSAGNWNSTMESGYGMVTVLNSAPSVPVVYSPYDGEVNNTRKIEFSSTDADGDSITYNIYINGTLNITTTSNITVWNGSDGYYNLTVSASDGTNTSANSPVIYFKLDTVIPYYNTTDITAWGINLTNSIFYFNVTWTDDQNISSWIISNNQSGTWVNQSGELWAHKDNNWYISVMNFTIAALKNTVFNVVGYANDGAGNWNSTEQITITVLPPSMSSIIVNSTLGTNTSDENLTAYPQDLSLGSRALYDWRRDGSSIAILNMPFDGNVSDTNGKIKDYSQYGNNGTVTGATYNATGGNNGTGAYQFDGDGDMIQIEDNPVFNFTSLDNFSISVWFKPDTEYDTNYFIVGKRVSFTLNTIGYVLQRWNNNVLWRIANGTDEGMTDSYPITVGKWYHLAGVHDASTDNMSFYINGNMVESLQAPKGSYASTRPLTIMADSTLQSENTGTIDELLIFNLTLSQEQINMLYSNRTDIISSQIISDGEEWAVCATPNDNFQDGTAVCSINQTVAIPDTTAPTFTNISNQTIGYGSAFTQDINATDDTAVDCFSVNDTTNFKINCSGYLENNTALGIAVYWLNITVNDTSGNENYALMWVNVSDIAPPQINFTAPTPTNGTTQAASNVIINVSIIESSLKELIYNWNGTNYTYYNDSLVLMYNFDNVSALGENDSFVVDMSRSGNDGSVLNGTWVSSGVYNGAYEFDGNENYIITEYSGRVGTLSFWFKTNDFKNAHSLFGQRYDSAEESGNWQMHWNSDDDQQIRIQAYNSTITGSANLFSTTFELDTWYYVALTSDGSTLKYYVNGVFDSIHNFDVYLGGGNNDDYLRVGGSGENDVNESFNGTLDEVRVWNITLNAQEVYQQYVSNLKKIDSDSWELYINQSLNTTDGLTDGTYTYQAYAKDISGNENSTETRFLTVDTTYPVINITSPVNSTTYPNYVTQLKYTLAETNGDSCWYSNGSVNYTAVTAGVNWSEVNSSKGSNTWTVWCNDTAGNLNSSSVTFTVDNTAPNTTLVNPTLADASTTADNYLFVNASAADDYNISTFIDFDGSLVSWWRMDDLNSSGDGVTDYMDRNNGTIVNAVQTDAGYMGKGFSFDGIDDCVDFGTGLSIETTNFTLSTWVYPKTTGSYPITIIQKGSGAGGRGVYILDMRSSTQLEFAISSNGWSARTGISRDGILSDSWNHIAAKRDYNDKIYLYINGVEVNSSSESQGDISDSNNLYIGTDRDTTAYFNGTIDDVMVFNRSLSAAEIQALYANTSSRYLEVNFTSLGDGPHSFTAYAQDMAGNVNSTEERTITIDANYPTWQNNKTNLTSAISSGDTAYFNITLNDSNPDKYVFSWYNTTDWLNDTAASYTDGEEISVTKQINASSGTINWTWYFNDTAGNLNQTEVWSVTLADLTKPNSNISINNTTPKINDIVNISMNVSDETGLSACWFYNNMSGVNSSLISLTGTSDHSSCYNVTTINVSQGKVVLFIGYVNDTTGNLNSSRLTITVVNSAPSVPVIYYPSDGESYASIPYMNYSSSDADGDAVTYKVYINGTLNASTSVNLSVWNASDGYYNMTVSAYDGIDTSANSSSVLFTLDSTAPTVSILYPIDGSNISSNSIDLNVSAIDSRVSSLTYYWMINGTVNTTTVDSNSTFNASDGYYNLTLFVSDGLQNGSDSVMFTLDSTAPAISITTPLNDTVAGWNVLLQADINDLTSVSVSYQIRNGTMDDPVIYSGILDLLSGSIYNATFATNDTWPYDNSALNSTNLTLVVIANDTLGNTANASTYFVLDNSKPGIQYVAPLATGGFFNSNFSLNVY
ncbi:MAG: LamG domain-containing protein, partial [Candidatus Omnitrophica bacterium]|nr:LamG domain-containing protein [Candidatus Omnitrophota bacterium]